MEKIPRSKGEGEEMRKTALFFFTGGSGQGLFLPSSLILLLPPACCSGSRAESPVGRGGWVGIIRRSRGRTERAAVSATIGAASGEMANSGSRVGTELGSRHLRTAPLPPASWPEVEGNPEKQAGGPQA